MDVTRKRRMMNIDDFTITVVLIEWFSEPLTQWFPRTAS